MVKRSHDIAIIGGGVNGCGIARDAAGRGLSVYLCEQRDLASGTSSASTKLLHGGLRYLEYYEFRLVREALKEREVVLRIAPHIVRPLRFVLPQGPNTRPSWMVRIGLFLYDHLGGRELLPASRTLDLREDPAGEPLKAGFRKAFEYSDCWIDDARLVVLNARDAADRGATIKTRVKAVAAERHREGWRLTTEDQRTGEREIIAAKVLVNAAGPWVGEVLESLRQPHDHGVRLVQGSHIVVPRLFDHERCYIFQNKDGRIIFAIPYEGRFTLIGTTDTDYVGDPARVVATEDEIRYLCESANAYFAASIAPRDVVWAYSGVRSLLADGSADAKAATRDYLLELDDKNGAPLLTVFGGKITTYRRLAEQALGLLGEPLPRARAAGPWTARAPLPGGDFPPLSAEALAEALRRDWPLLTAEDALRLIRAYGTRARRILSDGPDRRTFGAGLGESEVRYLMREEFAVEVEDVIWRRSKLGLSMTTGEVDALRAFMAEESLASTLPMAAASPEASRVSS